MPATMVGLDNWIEECLIYVQRDEHSGTFRTGECDLLRVEHLGFIFHSPPYTMGYVSSPLNLVPC